MNTSIIVSIDTRRSKKDGTFPIILRLTHKRNTTAIGTGLYISLSDWDEKNKKIKNTYKGVDTVSRLNNIIQRKKIDAFSIITKLEESNKINEMSITELKDLLVHKRNTTTFLKYTLEQIEHLKESGRFGSARAYHSMYQVIEKFLGKKDISFEEITVKFLNKLEVDYLSRGNALNGLAAILRSFRACYNKGINDGILEKGKSPFESYKIRKTPTVKRAITQESINSIMALQLEVDDPCFHARNYFLFSYLAFGMNFTDMALLSIDNIVDGRLHYIRQKTKQPYDLKIMEVMKPILDFYTEGKKGEEFIFPILKRDTIENQYKDIMWARKRYNTRLKQIAEKCKIQENLTSYVSRHSAATTALFLNVPLPAISKMMGHKSISTTQTYLKGLPSTVIDDYHELLEKALG
jgi:integrase/recombinase XerD